MRITDIYEAIAEVVKDHGWSPMDREVLINELAEALAWEDERNTERLFDRDKFFEACGLAPERAWAL